jgi:hypothetical protein
LQPEYRMQSVDARTNTLHGLVNGGFWLPPVYAIHMG